MADNVVDLNVVTKLATDPARIIARAAEAGLTSVVVLGFDADGDEFFASSDADGGAVLWHLERARHKLLSVPDCLSPTQ